MKESYAVLMCMVLTFTAFPDKILASVYQGDRIINILNKVKYAVIIDAGSTGSRVYIYDLFVDTKNINPYDTFDTGNLLIHPRIPFKSRKIRSSLLKWLRQGKYPINNKDDVKKIPSTSPIYLNFRQMLEFVNDHVGWRYRPYTPIFFIGTGGFRMLEDEEYQYYIKQVRILFSYYFYQYFIHEKYSVRVLSGLEEGLYSFISLQEMLYIQSKDIGKSVEFKLSALDYSDYDDRLLHISGYNAHNSFKYATIVEIGGASMQVVSPMPNYLISGDCNNDLFYEDMGELLPYSKYMLDNNIYKINYDSRLIHVFSKSYLGLGKQLAMLQYLHMVYNESVKEYGEAACFPSGFRALLPNITDTALTIELTEIIPEKFDDYGNIIPYIVGTGDQYTCSKQIDALLDKIVDTKMPYVIQDHASIIGMENIFYTLKRLMPQENYNFYEFTNADILEELGTKLCPMDIMELESHFVDGTEREKIQTFCFTVNLFAKILKNVLSLDGRRRIYPKNTILGNPLTWTLGAAILDIPKVIDISMDELEKVRERK